MEYDKIPLNFQSSPLKGFYNHPSNISVKWSEIDKERIPAIIGMLPLSISGQILEVGVGGGKLFQELVNRYSKVVGVDISETALSYIDRGFRLVAGAEALPFRNVSFDVCIVADVLEHLEESIFLPSVNEIARVTQKFLIVNCPYRDNIYSPIAKCMECNKEFNVYGHLRNFNKRKLKRLFIKKGFKKVKVVTLGPPRAFRNKFLLWLGRKLGKAYSFDFTLCPMCGSITINPTQRNFINKIIGKTLFLFQVLIDRFIPEILKPKSEIITLFKKIH